MIRVCFLTPSLGYGGAQMMLVKLLSRIDRDTFDPEIISLTEFIPLADRLKNLDVRVRILGMKLGFPDPTKLFRLASWLRASTPDLVQTWMYHADLIGGLAAAMAGGPPVIWNIRHSNLDPAADKRLTRITAKACAHLSHRVPRRIVCCAETARDIHVNIGYAAEKFEIIPNGFDLSAFRPDPVARARIREELGLGTDDFVIGLAARFHPQKDHRGFVKAAAIFANRCPGARFVLCGDEVNQENPELARWIQETGVPERFLLLGRRSDMPAVTAAFDVACSSSASGEAFSNTLGEAMACAIPCAATHVGDAAQIVGETGLIVPPGDSSALAAAWEKLFEVGAPGRQALGVSARQRVVENFSLEKITARYQTLFQDVLESSGHREGREQWRAC